MRVRLRGGRCVGVDRGTQIAEPRWRDHAKVIADEIGNIGEALVVATAGTMN